MACRHAVRQSGHKDLTPILKEISKSPQRPAKVRKLLDISTLTIIRKTPEEGLAFVLDNCLSKSTYLNMRLESKSCGADIWPIYNDVRKVKEKCRPPKETISIHENVAEVAVQPLLNHTAKRIINMQAAVILQTLRRTDCMEVDTVLTCTWGFDGSTGHSAYQQRWQNKENMSDESLFATTLIPLRLATSTGLTLWNNRAPQSSRFCRPIKFEFVKESIDVILRQKQLTEDQIETELKRKRTGYF
ncbi:dna-mediated transposase [Lasius niger]|uniref:Dna-mediated transposase n=1 Tax=Lasius niger TaxID=67767 RepID=A0A0J7KAT9_LASNI|nr:dna-mediated transposase [Lasius niger]